VDARPVDSYFLQARYRYVVVFDGLEQLFVFCGVMVGVEVVNIDVTQAKAAQGNWSRGIAKVGSWVIVVV